MRKNALVCLLVIILGCSVFSVRPKSVQAEEEDLMTLALNEIQLTKEKVLFTDNGIDRTYGKDPFRLPFFNNQLKKPLNTPSFLKSTSQYLIARKTANPEKGLYPIRDSVWMGAYRLGYTVASYAEYEPDFSYQLAPSLPLLYAIADIYRLSGKILGEGSFLYIKSKCETIPLDTQREIALLLYYMMDCKINRDKAFRAFSMEECSNAFRNPAALLMEDAFDPLTYAIAKDYNYSQLFFSAVQMGKALDRFSQKMDTLEWPDDLSLEWCTPWGWILLRDELDQVYYEREILFSLDLGGNDTYYGNAGSTASWFNPVSIVMDCAGDDNYKTTDETVYSQGSGVFGYGMLLDFDGDDHYEAKQYAQGFGCFGVGLLWDKTGDDSFQSVYASQACGIYGIGVLMDQEGNDQYEMYTFGQGFGYVRGYGCLIDYTGDDSYVANDTDVAGNNPQSSEHNTSFCQGAGFGRRADLSEGNSISGGIGMLIDAEGQDSYFCGVFGQGTGYWAGTGYLCDSQGDDHYRGVWYVQGGAAHFGIGALFDDEGNDEYNALMNMAQGAGHDLSLGFLLDKQGDDVYTSPNLALGGGNDNGMGFFVDFGGNDMYNLRSKNAINLGKANYSRTLWGSWRDSEYCLGFFFEHGGEDTYQIVDKDGKATEKVDFAENNKTWKYTQKDTFISMGVGIDTETGTLQGFLP